MFEMALADEVLDAQVRHQIGLHRLATGIVQRIVALLDRVDEDLVGQLRVLEEDGEPRSWTAARLGELLREVRAINRSAYAEVQRELTDELLGLAEYEEEFQLRLLGEVVPVRLSWTRPSRHLLRSAVLSRPFQGALLREWVAGMEEGRARRLREAVRIGQVEGETVAQIVRRVRGTRAAGFRDGILQVSRRSAETVVRTAVAHVAVQAREVLYRENEDLIKGVQWVSTLDLRTSPVCRARDGKVFEPDRGPRPPAHLNALAAGTRIATERGSILIEDVRPGDLVVTHRGRLRPVYATMSKIYEKPYVLGVHLDTGGVLWTTDEHPILVRGLGWKHADQLQVGDQLFQHPEYMPEEHAAGGLLSDEPDHYPPVFDEREVFDLVDSTDARLSMLPSVDFQAHFYAVPREVEDAVVDDKLVREGDARPRQVVTDRDFGWWRRAKLLLADAAEHLALYFWAMHRVALGHPLAVHLHQGIVGLVAPMEVVGLPPLAFERSRVDGGPFSLTADADVVSPAPGVKYSHPQAVLTADFVDRLALAEVLARDQVLNGVSVGQVHGSVSWCSPTITLIVRRPAVNRVFNLAVVEDETFLAEGVVVHNCRSTTVPVLKSWRELGLDADEVPEGTRASMSGQVAADLTYGEWLRRQPASVQDEVLGASKGRLFRAGGLPMDKFVDATGRAYTLDELRRREGAAWARAGLAAGSVSV